MFQQNAIKWFFVCVTDFGNIKPLFHEAITSHDPLQKIYPNLARTCKNKFYDNIIKVNWLNLSKNFYYGITDRRGTKPPTPVSDRVKKL